MDNSFFDSYHHGFIRVCQAFSNTDCTIIMVKHKRVVNKYFINPAGRINFFIERITGNSHKQVGGSFTFERGRENTFLVRAPETVDATKCL